MEQILNEQFFSNFKDDLENILRIKVKLKTIIKSEKMWEIDYEGITEHFELKLFLLDISKGEKEPHTYIDLEMSQIKIGYIEVNPKSKGIGRAVVKRLITRLKYTDIKRIILLSETKQSTNFWEKKMKFKRLNNDTKEMPTFYYLIHPPYIRRLINFNFRKK